MSDLPRAARTPESVPFRVVSGRDELVHAVLEADAAYGRWRDLRERVESGLVIASVLPGLALLFPSVLPGPVRGLAFAAWAGFAAVTVFARAAEARWRKRLGRRAATTLHRGEER